ncbi:7044_t:CDS:2, partial [Acaulospora morrowiae]
MNSSFFVSTPRKSKTFRPSTIPQNFYTATLKHMVCLDTVAYDALRSQLQYFQHYITRDDISSRFLEESEKMAEISWRQFEVLVVVRTCKEDLLYQLAFSVASPGVKNNLLTEDPYIDITKFSPFTRAPVNDIVKRCNLAIFSHFMFDPHNPELENLEAADNAFYYFIIPTEICQNDSSLFWRLSLDLKTQLYIQAIKNSTREYALDQLFPRIAEQPPEFIEEYVQRREQLKNNDTRLSEIFPWTKFIKEMYHLIVSISESIPPPLVSENTKSILTTTPDRSMSENQQSTMNSEPNLTPPVGRFNVGRTVHIPRNAKYFGAWNKYENASERDLTAAMDHLGLRPMSDQENNSNDQVNRDPMVSDPMDISTSVPVVSSSSIIIDEEPEEIDVISIPRKNITPGRTSTTPKENFMTPTVLITEPPPQEDSTSDESENTPTRDKRPAKKPRKKSEWKESELNALIAGMKEFNTSWSQIKHKYKGALSRRDPMHLKDKARTECERRIKMKIPLGVFEIV